MVTMATGAMFSINAANAAGTYNISCKNDAYGMQLGDDYTQTAYVYNSLFTGNAYGVGGSQGEGALGLQYLIRGGVGAYVGNHCIYSGSADTNGTAVVAGDVARLAVSAIVGAVSNRIDMAFAARDSGASATGLSFSTQGDGFSMAANKVLGGLSFWADYGNSSMENTMTYTNVRLDSMQFDGKASSYSVGVDKVFGKALVGIVVSNMDTDITTTFNSGTYKQEVDTYGVYFAYKTSMLQIDLGTGQGDSSITTTRRDLGNDSVINGKTTADIEYSHARVAATLSRGRFSLVPHASYRTMDMDIAAFVDDRANENSSTISGDGEIFTSGSIEMESGARGYGLTVTDDSIAARTVTSETISFGATLSANMGKIVPYVNFSYDSEDTSVAAFKGEVGTDGNALEQKASDYTSSTTFGGGINFMLGSHVTGGVRAGQVSGRDDWKEDYFAGSLSIGF